jgi:hypothetical protein
LATTIRDVLDGRISPTEANARNRRVSAELRAVEAALRTQKALKRLAR